MHGLKEATVQELAELSGRTAQSLYPHLDALVDAHFLTVREPAETGRRSRLYACGPTARTAPTNPQPGDGNRQAAELAALMLHDAGARLRRHGLVADALADTGSTDQPYAYLSELTWIDDERRRRINEHFAQILSIVQEGRAERKGRRTNVLLYHFPDVTLREARAHRAS